MPLPPEPSSHSSPAGGQSHHPVVESCPCAVESPKLKPSPHVGFTATAAAQSAADFTLIECAHAPSEHGRLAQSLLCTTCQNLGAATPAVVTLVGGSPSVDSA